MEEEIKKRIEKIKQDERLTYKPADIRINAPLALVQVSLKARLWELEDLLGIPKTKVPIER